MSPHNNSVVSLSEIKKSMPSACKILAVSKLQPTTKIRALYQQGQRMFAENYVQEFLEKAPQLSDLNIEWHFIGRLQKNKAKQVVGAFTYIHSVDSLELAKMIDQVAEKKKIVQKIFIQINLSEEDTKGGIVKKNLPEFLQETLLLKHIEVVGLMTMPPLFEDPELTRPYFRELKILLENEQLKHPTLKLLSMGTSSDYHIAIEEGSNIVRLGTILFGERIK